MTKNQSRIYEEYVDEFRETRLPDDDEDGMLVGLLWFIIEQQDKELAEWRAMTSEELFLRRVAEETE